MSEASYGMPPATLLSRSKSTAKYVLGRVAHRALKAIINGFEKIDAFLLRIPLVANFVDRQNLGSMTQRGPGNYTTAMAILSMCERVNVGTEASWQLIKDGKRPAAAVTINVGPKSNPRRVPLFDFSSIETASPGPCKPLTFVPAIAALPRRVAASERRFYSSPEELERTRAIADSLKRPPSFVEHAAP